MSDLVAATGMNRAGLYSAFGSKHQLYITALARYREDTEPEVRAIARRALDRPDAEGPDAPGVVGDILEVVARHSKEGGFIVRAAVELADDPATMRRVQEAWAEARLDGVDDDCMAMTCLFAAFAELVSTYGEEAAAQYADSLSKRIRNGEFTLDRTPQ